MLVSASIPALACCNSVPSAFPFHLHGLIGVKTKGRSRREVSRGRRSHFAIVRRGVVGGGVAPLAHVQARLLLYPPLLPVGRRRLVQGWRKVGRRWLAPHKGGGDWKTENDIRSVQQALRFLGCASCIKLIGQAYAPTGL